MRLWEVRGRAITLIHKSLPSNPLVLKLVQLNWVLMGILLDIFTLIPAISRKRIKREYKCTQKTYNPCNRIEALYITRDGH